MTAVEMTFTILAIVAFLATAWVCGLVVWRLIRVSKR